MDIFVAFIHSPHKQKDAICSFWYLQQADKPTEKSIPTTTFVAARLTTIQSAPLLDAQQASFLCYPMCLGELTLFCNNLFFMPELSLHL